DADRRRLSLSLKRVEEGAQPLPRADGAESVHMTPKLDLSEDVFPASASASDADAAEVSEPLEGATDLEPSPQPEVAEQAAGEPELQDAPALESDAAAEVELEAESTVEADGAAGDEPPDQAA
nr:hypothetical protein [Actinomycetota bacterium]